MNTAQLTMFLGQTAAPALDRVNEFVVTHAGSVVVVLAVAALVLIALFRRWVWRELSALQTAQIAMIFLLPFLFAGVLLPQDGNYEDLAHIVKWGWGANLVKGLRLMNVYQAAPIYVLLAAIMICALACSLHNLRALLRKRAPAGPTREEIQGSPGGVTLKLEKPFAPEGVMAVYNALKEGGLRGPRVEADSPPSSMVFETGSGTLWPAVLFHLGMVLLATGCLVTWLFGFGGYVSVYMGHPEAVPMVSKETRWQFLRAGVCAKWDELFRRHKKGASPAAAKPESEKTRKIPPEDYLWLGLERLRTNYEQWPDVNYPCYGGKIRRGGRSELAIQRFRAAWGYGREELRGSLSDQLSGPTEISAKLVSYILGEKSLQHHLRPGHSIKTEGLNIALVAADFEVDLEVEGAPPLKGVVQGASFKIPGALSQYFIDHVTAGSYTTFDGRRVELTPTVYVRPMPSPGSATGAAEKPPPAATVLPLKQGRQLGGKMVRVTAVTEGCVLRYQHDPGKLIWTPAAILILIALCARVYWSHYRVNLFVEGGDGMSVLHVAVDAHGILSDPDHAVHAVKSALRAKGLLAKE